MHRPLRILQVSPADRGGGAIGSARSLFDAYRAHGHGSRLAVGRKYSSDPDIQEIPRPPNSDGMARLCWKLQDLLESTSLSRVLANRTRSRLRDITNVRSGIERRLGIEDFNYPGTWELLNLAPDLPDIVHLHNLHRGYFDLRYLPVLSNTVPVILNLRDMWLLTGHCAYPMGCTRWKTGCGRCPDLSIYPAVERDATAYNWRRKRRIFADSRLYVVAPSAWLLEKVRVSIPTAEEFRVIPNGIDLNVFRPASKDEARRRLDFPTDARVVLIVGHSQFKDLELAESALEQLQVGSTANLVFICVGRESPPKKLGNGRITYEGFVRSNERLALFFQAADVLIHAAKAEAFGKTIIEAQACGAPVVATATGGIREIISDEETGFLVSNGDSKAIAARVRQLLENPGLSRAISKAGRDKVETHYSLEVQVEAFLDWYMELVENSRSVGNRSIQPI